MYTAGFHLRGQSARPPQKKQQQKNNNNNKTNKQQQQQKIKQKNNKAKTNKNKTKQTNKHLSHQIDQSFAHATMAVVSPQTFSWEETKLSRAASGMSLGLCFDTVTQWHEANMLDNRQLAVFLRLEVVSSIPAGSTMIYRFLCVGSFISFPVPEHQN